MSGRRMCLDSTISQKCGIRRHYLMHTHTHRSKQPAAHCRCRANQFRRRIRCSHLVASHRTKQISVWRPELFTQIIAEQLIRRNHSKLVDAYSAQITSVRRADICLETILCCGGGGESREAPAQCGAAALTYCEHFD